MLMKRSLSLQRMSAHPLTVHTAIIININADNLYTIIDTGFGKSSTMVTSSTSEAIKENVRASQPIPL